MRQTLLRLAPVLHLTRVTTAFAAVANVWFIILWTRASAENEGSTLNLWDSPLWLLLLGGAVNALGLFTFAAALNDVLDQRRDRMLHPERPIPSGRLSVDWAIALVVGTFMAAVLGATVLGMDAVVLTILVAAAVLFFNAAGKFIPAIGLVVLGLIYAGQMVIPNLRLVFVWPVWLVMTHSLVVGGLTHVLARRVPVVSRRAVVMSIVGWAFWTAVMLYAGWIRARGRGGLWPDFVRPDTAIWPALLVIAFAVTTWRKVRVHGPGARASEKIGRYGALWQALYACAWLLGQRYIAEFLIVGTLTAAGFLGMTVLREVYGLIERPPGYRR
jgi:hypothetical protein